MWSKALRSVRLPVRKLHKAFILRAPLIVDIRAPDAQGLAPRGRWRPPTYLRLIGRALHQRFKLHIQRNMKSRNRIEFDRPDEKIREQAITS